MHRISKLEHITLEKNISTNNVENNYQAHNSECSVEAICHETQIDDERKLV